MKKMGKQSCHCASAWALARNDSDLVYKLIRSNRKTLSLQITSAGELIVRCPRRMAKREVDAFVASKRGWIGKHLASIAAQPHMEPLTETELAQLARQAAEDLPPRVARFAREMGVTYGRVTIRSQRSRWGSCSSRGNLNFNCLLMLAPPEVRDYVVIHELCHRKEMNHSPRFWEAVAKFCPDYAARKRWLKDNGGALIRRLPEKKTP